MKTLVTILTVFAFTTIVAGHDFDAATATREMIVPSYESNKYFKPTN